MIKAIIKWFIFSSVIMATCYLPQIEVENFAFAMLIALILTIINMFFKPILKIITFPINMLTFGLFNLFINFAILYAVSYFIPQYSINNYLSAFYASLIISFTYSILKKI